MSPNSAKAKPYIASMGIYVMKASALKDLLMNTMPVRLLKWLFITSALRRVLIVELCLEGSVMGSAVVAHDRTVFEPTKA